MRKLNINEYIGKKFGKLTILREDANNKYRKVICQCECGKEKAIRLSSIISKTTTTCGCGYYPDLKGLKIGKLFVIDSFLKNRRRMWICRCECGNEKHIRTYNLVHKKVCSCGCYFKHKPSKKRLNLLGMKFERLTVIAQLPNRNGATWWKCKCDCGNEKDVRGSHLVEKKYAIKSCGCLLKEQNIKQRLSYGQSSFNKAYRCCQKGAIDRGIDFNLSKDEYRILVESNCFYCGEKPSQVSSGKSYFGRYIHNGVDRVDSQKGYSVDNCVPCCTVCNRMKLAHSLDFFKNQINKIYTNLRSRYEL